MFEQDQLSNERDRLSKLGSLTVLDYIRTSIEILMQMKLEEEKNDPNKKDHLKDLNRLLGMGGVATGEITGRASEFTSTF